MGGPAGGSGGTRAATGGAGRAMMMMMMMEEEEERDGHGGGTPPPPGGGPAGVWFQFGFRFGAPTEAGLQPDALGEAGSIRALRPSWSFSARLTEGCAGAPPGWLLGGAWWSASSCPSLPLPPDCLDVLPSETHVVLLREAALEAWPVAALLGGRSPGGGGGGLVRLDGKEAAAAWRRELLRPEEEAEAPRAVPLLLPRVPGGFVAPRPPFFTPLPASLRARHLALGHEHVLLLDDAGGLFAWGGGRHGQLGHGDLESRTEPQQVEALQGVPVQEVAAGGWHSAAIGGTGDLYLWGWNESGQLALPSKDVAESQEATTTAEASGGDSGENLAQLEVVQGTQQAAFISIQAFPALLEMPYEADVCKVSCGSRHTAAVTRTGDLYTWGWGKYGQLGHQDTVSSDQPRRVCYFVDRDFCVVDVVCGPWTTYTLAVGR